MRTDLERSELARFVYNKSNLALPAGHKAGFEIMHTWFGAGREQGFEQLSLEIRAPTLDDVPVSHRLTIQAYPNSPRTQRQLRNCLSYTDEPRDAS